MSDPVETYLQKYGPALSSRVATHLVDTLGMKAEAARKRVSRARGEVFKLNGLTFPHKARFIYLRQQFGSPAYWDRLTDALIESRSAYGYAIAALRQRDGIVPARYFPIVCGAPVRQARHLAPETILARLTAAGLVTTLTVPDYGECVVLVRDQDHYVWRGPRLRAQLITENILLLAVKEWLQKLNFGSYGKVAIRDEEPAPKVGTFLWDLSAPSYLGPMVRVSQNGGVKNGFFTCDVMLGDVMTAAGVAPFIRKCTTLRGLRNVGPCLQMLVADRYDEAAFHNLRKNGIIPATPASLFAEDVADGLRQLSGVLEAAGRSAVDGATFDELFKKLGKIEGAAHQLRGTLFEYLAAQIARTTISTDIRMNRLFKPIGGGQAEADVVAINDGRSITIIECKGYSPRGIIPDVQIERWLLHNVPTCFREIGQHPDWRNLEVRFELWVTGRLSPAALALIEKARSEINPERYSIALRLGPDLQALCRQTNDGSLIRAFEQHYLPPPVEDLF